MYRQSSNQNKPTGAAIYNESQIEEINDHRKRMNNRFSPLKKTMTPNGDIGLIMPKADKIGLGKYDMYEQKVFGEDEIKQKKVRLGATNNPGFIHETKGEG